MAALDLPQMSPVDAAEARFEELLDVVGQRAGKLVARTQTHVGRWQRELQAGTLNNKPNRRQHRPATALPLASISSILTSNATLSANPPSLSTTSPSFASVTAATKKVGKTSASPVRPTLAQLLTHPLAILGLVPKDAAFFLAGAVAGATAKSTTAPLDRWKLMLQVRSVQLPAGAVEKKVGLLESFLAIGKEEGVLGYWRGNLPQVIRIIPYSAVQLFAYEFYKKTFKGSKEELSVPARLAAGACAGMTSTLVTYPLDVLRLRLAVDPASRQMGVVALNMLKEEGVLAFYKGLGPSLLSIAPYIALNFCAFDLIKKSIPEKHRKSPQASFVTALAATTFATVMCYPLDTVRRQMQMKGSPYTSVLDAFPGIIKRDGVAGLYRGFIANALKNLPNSSIRLTTYDALKNLISTSQITYRDLVDEREAELAAAPASTSASSSASKAALPLAAVKSTK